MLRQDSQRTHLGLIITAFLTCEMTAFALITSSHQIASMTQKFCEKFSLRFCSLSNIKRLRSFPTSFPHIFSYFVPLPPHPISTFSPVLHVSLFLFAFSLPTLCLPFPLLLSQFINCLSTVPKDIVE